MTRLLALSAAFIGLLIGTAYTGAIETILHPRVTSDIIAVQLKTWIGKSAPLAIGIPLNKRFGAIVYLAGPISSCSLDAKLPGTDPGSDIVPVVFLYSDSNTLRFLVAKPKSPSITVKFDASFRRESPSLFSFAPIALRIDGSGTIVGVVRPLRVETVQSLKAFMRMPL